MRSTVQMPSVPARRPFSKRSFYDENFMIERTALDELLQDGGVLAMRLRRELAEMADDGTDVIH